MTAAQLGVVARALTAALSAPRAELAEIMCGLVDAGIHDHGVAAITGVDVGTIRRAVAERRDDR